MHYRKTWLLLKYVDDTTLFLKELRSIMVVPALIKSDARHLDLGPKVAILDKIRRVLPGQDPEVAT